MNTGFSATQLETIGAALLSSNRNALFFINVLKIMMELRYYEVESGYITNLMQRSIQQGFSISDIQVYPIIVSRDIQKGIRKEDSIASLLKEVENGTAPSKSFNGRQEGPGARSGSVSGEGGEGTSGGGGKGSSSAGGGKSGPSK